MKSTNYRNAFIRVAADCRATTGAEPKPGTIGALQLGLLREAPYRLTSDDLLFEVFAIRNGVAAPDRAAAREALFAKPQACLRASPLVKTLGWGLHHDADGRVAAYAVESAAYGDLAARSDIAQVPGIRSKRGQPA